MDGFMKSIQTLQDEHLKSIKLQRKSVISNVIEMSEMTRPLLASYLLYVRKLNSVHNKIDDKNESARMLQEYNYLCEHNLLYFLTVTHQFALIRELFQNTEEMAALMHLIYEIEQEYKQAKAQHDYLVFDANQKALHQEHSNTSLPISNDVSGFNDVSGLNEFLLYQHYDAMYKAITFKHHVAQIDIFDAAYEARKERMDEVRQAVLNNPSLSMADKKAVVDMKREYIEEYTRINTISTTHPDGSPNYEAAAEKAMQMRSLEDKYGQIFENKLSHLINLPGIDPNLKSFLGAKLHEEREATQQTQEKIVELEQNHHEEVKEVLAHRQANQQGGSASIKKLIEILKDVRKNKLPVDIQPEFNSSMEQLNELYIDLKNEHDPMRQKILMQQCVEMGDNLQRMVEPSVNALLIQELKSHLDQAHRAINASNSVVGNEAPQASIHVFSQVSVEEQPGLANEITAGDVLGAVSISVPSDPSPNGIAPSAPDIEPGEPLNVSHIEAQRKIKATNQEQRNAMSANDSSAFNVEQFIKGYENGLMELEELMDFEEFSEDELQIYEKLKAIYTELANEPGSKAFDQQKISEVVNAFGQLAENHESLALLKNKLEDSAPKIINAEEPGGQNSFRI